MDPLRVIAQSDGVFLRREALEAGYNDQAIAQMIRSRSWVRVRVGSYTFPDIWDSADPAQRHRILARAVLRRRGPGTVLTHVSAVLELDIAVWGIDLTRVHVTTLDGRTGRRERDVVVHEGRLLDSDVALVNGLYVVRPTRAVLETASLGSIEAGVVSLDSALHKGVVTAETLAASMDEFGHWPGTRHLQVSVRLADGKAESVGESRFHFLCWAQCLPAPRLQYEVRDRDGRLLGTTDFGWEEQRLLGEFDGMIKYGRLVKEGDTPFDVVRREKLREDAIREATQFGMIRLTWDDLRHPARTAERIRRMMRSAA